MRAGVGGGSGGGTVVHRRREGGWAGGGDAGRVRGDVGGDADGGGVELVSARRVATHGEDRGTMRGGGGCGETGVMRGTGEVRRDTRGDGV